ncbi:hypothetical protein JAAARDRAFT_198431 [Jaapia argillacea MUCL 33604]|uniref:Protein kinase domain-containing protein n=1 Tax=Jaapia argillacea MUCL 33604 TaxID=933084 RepID=A0A067PM54_9AGAM|nr:hypothetical protein JAAARDRAFT_198431 [Jaapia argillacea MUCL 33604]
MSNTKDTPKSTERRRKIFLQWPRDPKGPVLPRPPPVGVRPPNGIIWGHSLSDIFWIKRIPEVNCMTAWSRSMIKAFGENYTEDEFDEPEHLPRRRRPWPVLKLPKGVKVYPPLGAIDEGSDHDGCYEVLMDDTSDDSGDDEPGEISASSSSHPSDDEPTIVDPLGETPDDEPLMVPNDPNNPIYANINGSRVLATMVWAPKIRKQLFVTADPPIRAELLENYPPNMREDLIAAAARCDAAKVKGETGGSETKEKKKKKNKKRQERRKNKKKKDDVAFVFASASPGDVNVGSPSNGSAGVPQVTGDVKKDPGQNLASEPLAPESITPVDPTLDNPSPPITDNPSNIVPLQPTSNPNDVADPSGDTSVTPPEAQMEVDDSHDPKRVHDDPEVPDLPSKPPGSQEEQPVPDGKSADSEPDSFDLSHPLVAEMNRRALAMLAGYDSDPEPAQPKVRIHTREVIPLDPEVVKNLRKIPKLEEFIPDKYFPDVLMVHDPDDLTPGQYRSRSTAKVGEEALKAKPIKYKRVFPVFDSNKTDKGEDAPPPRVAHLYLSAADRLGEGNHSYVYRALMKLPPPLSARSPNKRVTVAAKFAMPRSSARQLLDNEAKIYNQFPKHLMEEWCGYNLVTPCMYPMPVGPVAPKFYGYWVPDEEEGVEQGEVNEDGKSKEKPKVERSPILLLEECGTPIRPEDFNDDERSECMSLLLRLHLADFVQGSFYVRNVCMQPGPLTAHPLMRSTKTPSFRIIDFGRAEHWDWFEDEGKGKKSDEEWKRAREIEWWETRQYEVKKAQRELKIIDFGF